tara:strand:- start:6495 stop:7187 length:693 start_codon:yes stop_codon:yes gene_type:complete
MKKAIIAFSILCVLVLIPYSVYYAYHIGLWRANYVSLDAYPVQGLDVSHHQGEINWAAIPTDQFKFVYIKATEGGDFSDTRFQQNWPAAQQAGLKVGAYHFFTLCSEGKKQADHFIKTVPKGVLDLPPAIDLEFVGNCTGRPTRAAFEKELRDYIRKIEKHYQIQPVLYVTYEFYDAYMVRGPFGRYPLWLRDVWGIPLRTDWHIWQYAENGKVAGIKGPVDLNVMREQP